ncbi:MAG: family oxidoreductase [Rhodospirillales bacterium]|nr:family oxidoreductase [Rhodospirillales bacterium]
MSEVPPYPEGRDILKGKTVLVTASAGTGIGYATATRCAEEGATVMLSDIHEKRLVEYANRLEDKIGRKVHRTLCNVTANDQVAAMIAAAVRDMGRLDVLVNNAGLGGTHDLIDTTDDQWSRILDTNLTGTFRCMRAALPVMAAQDGGVIVNMSSICAWRAEAGQTAYAASKAGILALTRCAAIEAAPQNIRINAVVPSLSLHPYLQKVSDPDHLQQLIRENEVFGRSAEPWEIGNAIVFLASDYASYMTGESLSVSCRRA